MSTMVPPTSDTPTILRDRADVSIRRLRNRLESTRRQLLGLRCSVVVCGIVAMVAVCLAASAITDWIVELETVWRASWVFGISAAVMVVAIVGWKKWISNYDLSNAAVDAERSLTQFGQRLRTTVDYEVRSPHPAIASPSLLNSLREETAQLAERTEWQNAVDRRPLFKMLSVVMMMAFGWIAALVGVPEFRIAAARSILIPLEYTTVTFSPQSATIRPGESVTVEAQVSGRPIKSAYLRFRPFGSQGDWSTVSLVGPETDEDRLDESKLTAAKQQPLLHGDLTAVIDELTEDTEFEVVAGPRLLPHGSIRVLQPLVLKRFEIRVIPPSYTRRPTETVEKVDLSVLEGSKVEFTMELNRPAADAKLVRIQRAGDDGSDFKDSTSAEVPLALHETFVRSHLDDVRKGAAYRLTAQTADGMSLEPVTITIHCQLDQMPLVKFIEPDEELVVTPTTDVPMVVEASDDLGLLKVGVMYQVGSGPLQTLTEETPDLSNRPFRVSPVLMLENHALTYQEAVTYYAFAEDNYFDQPRRTTTPLRFIDIRPYKLEFQVVDTPSNCKGGSSVTLEELITRQRQGLSQAFQAGQQQSPSKEIASRLSESQVQVQDATMELAQGLAERGLEIPALNEAVSHMDNAIDALDTPIFQDAVTAEQKALAALISARENIRKQLNQADSQCASACKKFDREQRQKLRMPEKKKSDKQQQLAQTRQKIDELAKKERQWSEEAKQCCNSSSQSKSKSSESKESISQSSQGQPSEPSKPSESSQSDTEKPDAPKDPAREPHPDSKPDIDAHGPATPEEVAAKQEQLQAELAVIQKQLEQLDAAGKAARDQGKQAAESMQQGLAELKKQDGDAAAKEAERSAQQLEQLSDHLAAMNSRDFGQQLDQAQKLAQQLADRQETLEEQLRAQSESQTVSSSSNSGDPSSEQGKPSKGDKSGTKDGGKGKPNDVAASSDNGRTDSTSGSSEKTVKKSTTGELARDQQGLSVQTGLLAELLDRLKSDAVTEAGVVKQALEQADAKYPPREIAAGMRQTAEEIQAERKVAATQGATAAREKLQALSKSLGAVRGEYAQPQLKELMALEEQLAQLQEQMKRAQTQGEDSKANAGQKWQQLESRLDKMAAADRQLAEALQKLREGPQSKPSSTKDASEKPGEGKSNSEKSQPNGTTQGGKAPPKPGSKLKPSQFQEINGQPVPEGFYSWLELGDFSGVREVSKALQTRIQEAILAGALIDADQPVPPAYKELVEKYYRALSDDLR